MYNMVNIFIRKKNCYRYLFLAFIILFALISYTFKTKNKTKNKAKNKRRAKGMHWGYPKSTTPRMI